MQFLFTITGMGSGQSTCCRRLFASNSLFNLALTSFMKGFSDNWVLDRTSGSRTNGSGLGQGNNCPGPICPRIHERQL